MLIWVPKHHVVIIESLGKYSRTLSEGFHFILPFFESTRSIKKIGYKNEITDKIYLGEQKLILKNQKFHTLDGIDINLNISLYFQVVEPETFVLYDDIQSYIEKFIYINFESNISSINESDILSFIDKFNSEEFNDLTIDEQTDLSDLLKNTNSNDKLIIFHIISLHKYFKRTVFGIKINKVEIVQC